MSHFRHTSMILWLFVFFLLSMEATKICHKDPTDFIFLLDGSRSVRPSNFVIMKNYIKEFVNIVDELSPEKVQLGVVQFSSETREEIRLDAYTEKSVLQQAISNITYMQMGTMTGEALRFVVNQILTPSHGSRLHQGVHSVLIVLTDGKSQDYSRGTLTQYQRIAKERGTEIFAIGIGRRVNHRELLELASIPKEEHVYEVERFEDIEQIEIQVANQTLCDEDECASGEHNCDQICTNTESSFSCSCHEGYELQDDLRSCIANISEPVLPPTLWITNITHTSSQANWNLGDVVALRYQKADGKSKQVLVEINGETSAQLTDLQPSTTYIVQLAVSEDGKLTFPLDETFTTLTLGSTSVTLSNATLSTLTATWNPAGGDELTGYNLLYKKVEDENGTIVNSAKPAKSRRFGAHVHRTVLRNLDSNSVYFVQVNPLHGRELVGNSFSSQSRTMRLVAPHIAVERTTLSTMSIRWKIKFDYRIRSWTVAIYTRNAEAKRFIEYGADIRSATIQQLQPNTFYYVEIFAKIEDDEKLLNTPKAIASKRTRLLKKPAITVNRVSTSTLDLKWTEINRNTNSWTVRIYPKGYKNLAKQRTTSRNQRSASFAGLWPSTLYRIEVVGHVIDVGQTFSSPKGNQKKRTKSLTAPNVQVRSPTFSSFVVTWKQINEPVDSWTVKLYQLDSDEVKKVYKVPANELTTMIRRLQPNTQYRIGVYGSVLRDEIKFDGPEGFETGRTGVLSTPVVRVQNTTFSSLTVTWNAINEPVDVWVVRLYNLGSNVIIQDVEVNGNTMQRVFQGLHSNTSYRIAVFGRLARKLKEYESPVGYAEGTTRTLAVTVIQLQDFTFSSLTATWTAINEPVDYWIVRIYRSGTDEFIQEYEVDGDQFKKIFRGLQVDTQYRVTIFGRLFRQEKLYETSVSFAIGTTETLAAPQVQILNATFSSLTATWNAINEPVEYWRVVVYFLDSNDSLKEYRLSNFQKQQVISQLLSTTKYKVAVYGILTSNQKVYSSLPGFATGTTDNLKAPTVQVESSTYSSLTASWDAINEPVDEWILSLNNLDGNVLLTLTVNGNQFEQEFNDLQVNTQYRIDVYGRKNLRYGTYTGLIGSTMGATEQMTTPIVTISNITPISLSANWNSLNIDVDSWTVQISGDFYSEGAEEPTLYRKVINVEGHHRSAAFNNLTPGTDYAVEVSGNIGDIRSKTGQNEATTKILIAPPVEVTYFTHNSVNISWGAINVDRNRWRVIVFTQNGDVVRNVDLSDGNVMRIDELEQATSYMIHVVGLVTTQNFEHKSPPGIASATTKQIGPLYAEIYDITPFSMGVRWSGLRYHDEPLSDVRADSWSTGIKRQDSNAEEPYFQHYSFDPRVRTAIFTGLTPDTKYFVDVFGFVDGIRLTSRQSPKTDVISSPVVEISGTSYSTISVEWKNLNVNVSSWRLRVFDDEDAIVKNQLAENGINAQIFSGLEQGTVYKIQVVGLFNANGVVFESPAGEEFAETKTLISMMGPVVECLDANVTSLSVQWSDVSSDLISWNVSIFHKKQYVKKFILPSDQQRVMINNLLPQTTYSIRVTGNVQEEDFVFKTQAGVQNCSTGDLTRPVLAFSNITPLSTQVNWERINYDVDSWNVTITQNVDEEDTESSDFDHDQFRRKIIVEGTRFSAEFLDLLPETRYTIDVIGKVDSLQSQPGQSTMMTGQFTGPNVTIDHTSYTRFDLMWSNINVNVDNWRVIIVKNYGTDFSEQTTFEFPANQLEKTFDNLYQDTVYQAQVSGIVTSQNVLHESPIGEATTKTNYLGPPHISVERISPTSFAVSWSHKNPDIDAWTVSVAQISLEEDESEIPENITIPYEKDVKLDGSTFSTRFDDLAPQTRYLLIVIGDLEDITTAPGYFDTATSGLSAPQVDVANVAFSSIRVTWSSINTIVNNWRVLLLNADDAVARRFIVPGSKQTLDINELDQASTYKVQVFGLLATQDTVYNSPPGEAFVTTGELSSPNLTVTEITPFTARIRWTNINHNVDKWLMSRRTSNQEQSTFATKTYMGEMLDERDITLEDLEPSARYTIEVAGQIGLIRSTPGTVTFSTVPLSAPEIEIIGVTYTTISISWNKINVEVNGWNVKHDFEKGGGIMQITEDSSSARIKRSTISSLSEGTKYNISVHGVIRRGDNFYKSPLGEASAKTKSLPAIPDRAVKCANSNVTSLKINWSNISTDINFWKVSFHPLNSNDNKKLAFAAQYCNTASFKISKGLAIFWQMQTTNGSKSTIEINNLFPQSSYAIQVSGVIKEGQQYLETKTGRVNCSTGPLQAPSVTIDPSQTSFSSFTVRWSNINTAVDSWLVILENEDEAIRVQKTFDGSVRSAVFLALNPGTSYTVTVRGNVLGENTLIESPAGQNVVITDLLMAPVLECTTEVNGILLNWFETELDTPMDTWVFEIKKFPGDNITRTWELPRKSDENQYSVTGLKPQSSYVVAMRGRITTSNRTYFSEREEVFCVTADLSTPNVQTGSITPNSFEASWNNINYPADSWLVELSKVEDEEDVGYPDSEKDYTLVKLVQVPSGELKKTFADLTPDTEYVVKVIAIVDDIESKPGDETAVTTSTIPPIVILYSTTTSTIQVLWAGIDVPVDLWKIRLIQPSSETVEEPITLQETTVAAEVYNVTFVGLPPNSIGYNVQVAGVIHNKETTPGSTSAATKALQKPAVEAYIKSTQTTLKARWGGVNADVDHWIVKITSNVTGTSSSFVFDGDVGENIFEGLTPQTRYTVQVIGVVRGSNNETYQTPLGFDSWKTKPILPPVVRIPRVTTTTVGAQWGVLRDPVDRWTATIKKASDTNEDPPLQEIQLKSNQYSAVFVDLPPNASYVVTVKGHVGNFDSLPGIAEANTEPARAPRVTISDETVSSFVVNWNMIYLPINNWTVEVTTVATAEIPVQTIKELTVDADDRNAAIELLQPGTRYKVGVRGNWREFQSPIGEAIGQTESLTSPEVEISDSTYSTLTARWGALNVDTDGWIILLKTEEGSTIKTFQLESDVYEREFGDLEEGETYSVEVFGYAEIGDEEFESPTGEASGTTKSLISVAGPMAECVDISVTSLTIEWSDVSSDITSWTLGVYKGAQFVKKIMSEKDERSLLIDGLQPGSLYNIRITGNVREDEITFKTQTGTVACTTESLLAPEVTIDQDNITFGSIIVHWKDINSPVSYWIATIQVNESDISQDVRIPGNRRSERFTALDPETAYTVRVRPVILIAEELIEGPAGQASASTSFLSSPLIECSEIGLENLTLEWYDTDSNTLMDAWQLEIYPFDAVDLKKVWKANRFGEMLSYRVTGLTPDTFYIIAIQGEIDRYNKTYTTNREEIFCSTARLSTPLLSVTNPSPVSIRLYWESLNYPVDSWTVEAMPIPFNEEASSNDPAYLDDELIPRFKHNVTVRASVRQHIFENLVPETEYILSVIGNIGSHKSRRGFIREITDRLGYLRGRVLNQTATTIVVSWKELSTPVDQWSVIVLLRNGSSDSIVQKFFVKGRKQMNGDEYIRTIADLLPGELYRIKITGFLKGKKTFPLSLYRMTDALKAPLVEIMNSTLSTLSARWQAINAPVSFWKLNIQAEDNTNLTKEIIVDCSTLNEVSCSQQYTFQDLIPDSRYLVKVAGVYVDSNGTIAQSPFGLTAGATERVLPSPVWVNRTDNPTNLKVTWYPINVEVDWWVISYKEVQESDVEEGLEHIQFDQEFFVPGDEFDAVIDGLIPNTPYLVRLALIKNNYRSLPSTGQETTESLSNPEVSIADPTLTSMTVRWKPINFPVSFWDLQIRNVDDDKSIQESTLPSNSLEFDAENLRPGTRYRATVIGAIERNYLNGTVTVRSPSGQAEESTLQISTPQVHAEHLGPTELLSSWEDINIPVDFWVVSISALSDETEEELQNLPERRRVGSGVKNITFTNLMPGARYRVQVIGETSLMSSPPGQINSETEPLSAPAVRILPETPTLFYAFWKEINLQVDSWNATLKRVISASENGSVFSNVVEKVHTERDNMAVFFDGLTPGSTYILEVVGIIQDSISTPIGRANHTMDILTSPVVEITETSVRSLTARWSEINDDVLSWSVQLSSDNDGETKNFSLAESDSNITFEDLKPQTSYSVSVSGVVEVTGGNVKSPPGNANEITKAMIAPQVEIVDITPTSLRAEWTAINTEVDSWVASIQSDLTDTINGDQEDNTPFKEIELAGSAKSVEFDGLYPGTRYSIEILGQLKEQRSPPGLASNSTRSLSTPVVTLLESGVTSLTAQWSDINEDVSSWLVEIANRDTEETKRFSLEGSDRKITFEDLVPDTSYNVSIAGQVKINGDTAVQTVPGRIEGRTDSMTAPSVKAVNISPTSVGMVWSSINVPVDSWVVVERAISKPINGSNGSIQVREPITLDGSDRGIELYGLYPGTHYTVEVVGKLKKRTSPPRSVSFKTDALTRPTVAVFNSTLSTISIRWGKINTNVTLYNIEITNNKSGILRRYSQEGQAERKFLLEDLKPGRRYDIKVSGVVEVKNQEIVSPSGNTQGATMILNGPHVDCVETTANSVMVEWSFDGSVHLTAWTLRIYREGNKEQAIEVMQEMNANSYTFSQLQPATTYAVEVQGTVAEKDEEFLTPKMKDSCTTRPSSPANLDVLEQGLYHLLISFEPSTSHATYEALCISSEGKQVKGIVSKDGVVSCVGLDYSTSYLIQVLAVYKNLTSEPNSIVAATLDPPPLEMTLKSIATDSIAVDWNLSSIDGLEGYDVSYRSVRGDEEGKIEVDADQHGVVLTGLTPNTEYAIIVEGMKNQKSIVQSASENEKTLILLQIDDVSFNAINLSWSPSRVSDLQSYTLEFFPEDSLSAQEESLVLPPDVTKYYLGDLQTATEYNVSIRANYDDLLSSKKAQRLATTLASPPLGPLNFSDVTDSSFVARWGAPGERPSPISYTVTYFTGNELPVTIENVGNNYLLLEELLPLTIFNVSVSAVYDNQFESHPIKGTIATKDVQSTCSCSTYVRSQAEMQSLLVQMMDKIDALTQKVDNLSRSKSKRSPKRKRKSSQNRNH